MTIPEAARTLLNSGRLAHLVTLNPDGSPQMSCVWVEATETEIQIAHMGQGQKLKNLRRDDRVSLSMEAGTHNQIGLTEFLVVHGHAHLTEGGGADLLQHLAHRYMGPDVVFPAEPYRSNPGTIIHIVPTRFSGVGPWVS